MLYFTKDAAHREERKKIKSELDSLEKIKKKNDRMLVFN